jgi:group I intron endonuclease
MININSKIPIIGIYKITSPSDKIYIGQSNNIHYRWCIYQKYLYNCKNQPKLYNSLVKYGWEQHKFEIIEECLEEQLNEREVYWGSHYCVLGINGLNLRLGNGRNGFSDESKQKISKALMGNKNKLNSPMSTEAKSKISKSKKGHVCYSNWGEKMSKAQKGIKRPLSGPKRRAILQYDLDMNFIKEWSSIKIIGEKLKLDRGTISNVCNGKKKTCGGYKWKYKEDSAAK